MSCLEARGNRDESEGFRPGFLVGNNLWVGIVYPPCDFAKQNRFPPLF